MKSQVKKNTWLFKIWQYFLCWERCNKEVHYNKMAGTSQHYEYMEDLMGTEVLMAGVKQRNFQSIDNAADRIDDTSG